MIIKIIIVMAIFFGIKTVLKASKIVNDHNNQNPGQKSKKSNSNSDIIDAEYTNLD